MTLVIPRRDLKCPRCARPPYAPLHVVGLGQRRFCGSCGFMEGVSVL